MKLGIEQILENPKIIRQLKTERVALVCIPASVNHKLQHSFDLLHQKIKLASAFGPQHGVKGDKQDNMVETPDVVDAATGIPIFSLYGKVRRPTDEMMDTFDTLIFDLQDLGCRIYTFTTTLLYLLEACAKKGKRVIIADRPNPAGREIEGLRLLPGWESFVGASTMPMRHGLTMGEMAKYLKKHFALDLDLQIVKMAGYKPASKPGFGWPGELAWVNPSPNAGNLNMARAYPGTVLLEGTNLSEGRGTTRALEVIGAADMDFGKVLARMRKKAPQWLAGALLRECHFEPTFHKFQGRLCSALQIHTDFPGYQPERFKPYRLIALALKSVRELYPEFNLYRDFAYEYVENKLAFHVITGGKRLQEWIDDPKQSPEELEVDLRRDEKSWKKEIAPSLLYY